MIKLSQIGCASLRMELRKFNVNKTVNIPQQHFFLSLCIVAFSILFFI